MRQELYGRGSAVQIVVKSKRHLVPVLAAMLIFSGCSKKVAFQMPPPAVEITEVEQTEFKNYVPFVGTLLANQTVHVYSQVNGVIEDFYIKEGQHVKKGDPLLTIDSRPYEAELKDAEAQLLQDQAELVYSKRALERNRVLLSESYVSPLSIEELESQVALYEGKIEQDIARIQKAKIDLDYCYIKAPIAGKVSLYATEAGNLVKANSIDENNLITTVREMDPLQVEFSVSQRYLEGLYRASRAGDVTFYIYRPTNPEHRFPGTLFFIDNALDEKTGTLRVKGKVHNPNEMLWPGEFVRVEILVHTEKEALIIPSEALISGQKGIFVFVVDDTGTAHMKKIVVGGESEGKSWVKEGLSLGEKVVTLGQLNLKEGSPVRIVSGAEEKEIKEAEL